MDSKLTTAPAPAPAPAPARPWWMEISAARFLLLWSSAVVMLEVLGVLLAHYAVWFGWGASIAVAFPGPAVLLVVGLIMWRQRRRPL
jgi:hypothetical protein